MDNVFFTISSNQIGFKVTPTIVAFNITNMSPNMSVNESKININLENKTLLFSTEKKLINLSVNPIGERGLQGVQGISGVQGTQGLQGLQGMQGIQGEKGLQGINGIAGIDGLQGQQGLQGVSGQKGLQGEKGDQGLQGLQGPQGIQGIKGDKGETGSQGIQGPQGNNGAPGLPAINTLSGIYTPVITAEMNLDPTTTITKAQYMRVNNVVTVSGRFTANATLSAMATSFEISLPIVSNIMAVEDVAGTAVSGLIYGLVAAIVGSINNNTALIRWISSDINEGAYAYHFTYSII